MPAKPKSTVWISAGGHKHKLSTASGRTSCGLSFSQPFPGCDRTDPICKDCMRLMRGS